MNLPPQIVTRKTLAAVVLVVLHLGSALLAGAPHALRDRLWPLVAWYADGLRMTNTWGMFARPPPVQDVVIVGERHDGTTIELATAIASRRTWFQRIADARLRKIQSKLAKEDDRHEFGREYLAYFCREAGRSVRPLERVQLRVDPPRANRSTRPALPALALFSIDCTDPRAIPIVPRSGAAPHGDD